MKRNILQVTSSVFDAQAFDNLLSQNIGHKYVNVVDCRSVTFFDPYGLLCLYVYLRHLNSIGRAEFWPPRLASVRAYLVRMGFGGRPVGGSDVLLPITKVERESTVRDIVANAAQSVQSIIIGQFAFPPELVNGFCTSLAEICQNVPQHSGDIGFVAAQAYNVDKQPFLKLAVVDCGIGIQGSLNNAFPDISARAAIKLALKTGISRFRQQGRGLGLAQVFSFVQRFRGTLQIRSGNTRFYYNGLSAYFFDGAFFPGTQIGIQISSSC